MRARGYDLAISPSLLVISIFSARSIHRSWAFSLRSDHELLDGMGLLSDEASGSAWVRRRGESRFTGSPRPQPLRPVVCSSAHHGDIHIWRPSTKVRGSPSPFSLSLISTSGILQQVPCVISTPIWFLLTSMVPAVLEDDSQCGTVLR
jgi:hypothetical protein